MGEHDNRIERAARQHAETARLMGVDFLPISTRPATPAARPNGRNGARHAPAPDAPDYHAPPAGEPGSKAERLAALHREHDERCPHCTRATAHTQTVFGDGSPEARLMFIGEAPGAEEDRQGIPFVGASGRKLNEMIEAMGLRRQDVYIANVLKARPPNNDTPTPEEAERCGPYLLRQVEIIRPEVIVTLGKPAANFLLRTREAMGSLRGRWFDHQGIPVMPTFHPAFLLRQYTPENRKKVWSDLQQVIVRLGLPGKGGSDQPER
jgi:uracil-DNA glycosylase family 4